MLRSLYLTVIAFSFLLLSPIFFSFNLNANSEEVQYQAVNPSDGFKYGMKRLQEKTSLFFLSLLPTKKADYYNKIVNARLAELKYIVDKKDGDNFEVTTKRYFSIAGVYAEYLNKKNLEDKKKAAVETFKSHEPTLEKLRDTFDSQTSQWRFIQDDINYIKQYAQLLAP